MQRLTQRQIGGGATGFDEEVSGGTGPGAGKQNTGKTNVELHEMWDAFPVATNSIRLQAKGQKGRRW